MKNLRTVEREKNEEKKLIKAKSGAINVEGASEITRHAGNTVEENLE